MATLTCGVSTGSEIITEINDKINKAGTMLSATDINTVLTGGRYGCIGALNTNMPKAGEFYLEVLYDGTRTMQMAVYLDGTMYTRYYASAVWSAWVSHDHTGVYEPADATILKSASIGVSVQGYNVNTVIDASYVHTDSNYTTTEKTKVSNISITQPVDLDAIETRVNQLDASVVLKGVWDSSLGIFPTSTIAGESWIVSVGGTVDGIDFVVNDRIVALVASASSTIYASNWHKLDYTDAVLSVAGRTGAVVITSSDLADFSTAVQASSINNVVEDITPQLGGDLDLNGKSIPLALNAQVGTTYTAVLSDAEKIITLDNASPITMTIPANASVAYPIGTKLNFMQLGAGAVTVAITTDTLNHDAALTATLHGQYAVATAVKVAATSWVLFGNLGIV